MKCPVCGKEVEDMMYTEACSTACFRKAFWQEALDDTAIIINGNCYHIAPAQGTFKGFGGGKFHIIFNDGREVITTNLWHNGAIPEEYKKENNARFA